MRYSLLLLLLMAFLLPSAVKAQEKIAPGKEKTGTKGNSSKGESKSKKHDHDHDHHAHKKDSTATGTAKDTSKVRQKIEWLTFEQAVELNKKNPKKIFIDVYTDWCGWCKVMDANTFTNPQIIESMNKYFYPVKLNAEMKDTVVFSNITFVNPNPTQPRSTHQLASSLLNGKLSYPTTVYLDEEFKMLGPIPGYLKPADMEPILIFYGENKHKTTTWDEFMKTFETKIK